MRTDRPLPSRRAALLALAAATLATARPRPAAAAAAEGLRFGPSAPFSFDRLTAQARRLAALPWRPPLAPPKSVLETLDYDAIGQIRYRPEAALWKELPGDSAVAFFHLGRYARTPVAMHLVENGRAREILYAESLFEIPDAGLARRIGAGGGFAGFRVLDAGGRSDWIAYQGASYFRASTPFDQYGLSARGLAIDTATDHSEEFPAFTAFWLEHDAAGDPVVNALLDGPSVAGAYRIAHAKSAAGLTQTIEARLFFRRTPARLGVAPLTSMYWYGASDRPRDADWRPEIHDSGGLAIWTGQGERIWRPLVDPSRVTTNAFLDEDPRGFGLMQRDRDFSHYQDDGVFYDRRPSAWVEPAEPWGRGSVQLVEIPTDGETDDNIVAFWTPETTPRAGEAMRLRYRLYWTAQEPTPVGVARVVATRFGRGGRPGQPTPAGVRKYVVDFAGGRLPDLHAGAGVTPVVEATGRGAVEAVAYPVVGTDRWRLVFDLALAGGVSTNVRGFLRLGKESLTETWMYQALG